MSRICMRPGCDRDAAARLTYDPVGCEVWLDDLAERVGRSQEICVLHAERLTVPRGWAMSDRRSDEQPLFAPVDVVSATPAEPAPPPRRRRRRSTGADHPANQTLELFEVLRKELEQAEAAEEVEVEVVEAVEVVEDELVDEIDVEVEVDHDPDELPASLKATSPLLSRAFAATGHQRSVLTQRSPSEPASDPD